MNFNGADFIGKNVDTHYEKHKNEFPNISKD